MNNNKHLFMYKEQVGIPTLAMVDDIAKISICGTPSVSDNAYINSRIEQSKQLFNGTKCHVIHAGSKAQSCSELKAHENTMEVVKEEKYVGDVVTGDGKHTRNVASRRSKGIGITSEIMNILDGLSLGTHYFHTALMLRHAMLISVLLTNSETWLRLSKKDIDRLEGVDRMFLRRILHVPTSTPTTALYLETGSIPIRLVIKMRRILYLHHILTRDNDALIKRAFLAQVKQPVKGDWCIVVKEDLDYIGLSNLTFETISSVSKESLRTIVKAKLRETALKDLLIEKEKSSKLKLLKYTSLNIQPYLTTECKLNVKEKRTLFRWRSHMIGVKQNWGMKDAKCPLCNQSNDTQYHLLTCPCLTITQPWNIQSVIQALRQREIFLEEETLSRNDGHK